MAISSLKRGSEKSWRLASACSQFHFSPCPLWVYWFYFIRGIFCAKPFVLCRHISHISVYYKIIAGNSGLGFRFESAAEAASKAFQPANPSSCDAHSVLVEVLRRWQELPQRGNVEHLRTKQRERRLQQRIRVPATARQGMFRSCFYPPLPFECSFRSTSQKFFYQLECNLQNDIL